MGNSVKEGRLPYGVGRPRPPPLMLIFKLLRHRRTSGTLAPTFEAPAGIMIAAHD